MSLTERFQQYAAAFEETFADDDWSRLEPFFTEGAIYESQDDPFAFKAEGRDAVFQQMKQSLDTFDRRFATRELEVLATPTEEGNRLSINWAVTYSVEGAPKIRMTGSETATFNGDRIAHLHDSFDAEGGQAVMAWMSEHGAKLA